jgi:predicted RNA binding protein YcfA (HicA-like mRNA interferase family)
MANVETNRRKVVARLEREGWTCTHGAAHDLYAKPGLRGVRITVPRHRTLSPGVARAIAKAAGWAD